VINELINGVETGFSALSGAFLVIVPALISYACFNGFKNKTLVVVVGLAAIPIVILLIGFNFYLFNWKSVGIGIVTIYTGFVLGILAGKFFPWHDAPQEKMLSTKEVADILQIPEATVLHWIDSKFIFGFAGRVPERSLIEWLKKFSKINKLANKDDRIHWINRNLIEKVHLIRKQKEAAI